MRFFKARPRDATEKFLTNFVHSGNTVLDVGANIGQSALVAAYRAGAQGRVISFEPNPSAFAGLQAALAHARCTNVTSVQMALADKPGSVDFYVDTRKEYTGVASSFRELDDLVAAGQSRRITIACTTLDDYCAKYELVPDVIKIDVESAEPLVIEGGRRTIEKYRPVMLFEFWENWWGRGFRELFQYLAPMYRLIRMQDGVDVESFYETNTGSKAVDILCLPR
jgi:FkbM family methyltransferase